MMQIDIKEEARAIAKAAAEGGAEHFGELILQGIVGAAAPGVMGAMLAYKQARQERMYMRFLEELTARMEIIEERLKRLSAHSLLDFREKYFGMISDYAMEEVQEDKIVYIANGLTNLAGVEDPREDIVLSYYDTLMELRLLDIAILKNYYALNQHCGKPYRELLPVWGIDQGQYYTIRGKLERLGLLVSERKASEEDLFSNVILLQKCMEDMANGRSISRSTCFKNLSNHNNYAISGYGKSFMEFFA